jgi:hypothetical protein
VIKRTFRIASTKFATSGSGPGKRDPGLFDELLKKTQPNLADVRCHPLSVHRSAALASVTTPWISGSPQHA